MSHRQNRASRLDAIADRMINIDSPSYGDERERQVVLEASTLGYLVGTYLGLAFAVWAALTGALGASFGFFAVATLPAFSMIWFARRHRVDLDLLADRDRASRTRATAIVLTLVAGWVVAVLVMIVTGRPALAVRPLLEPGMHDRSTLWGLVAGAVVGALVGVAGIWLGRRRARRTDGDEPDDEF